MRRLLLLGAILGCAAGPASAAYPPPTLSLQSSFSPPTGIARTDLIDQTTSTPRANAVDGDRIYSVGEAGSGNSGDVGIVVHRADGTLDPTFSDDGKLVIAVTGHEDRAVDILVLPDHRLRVLAVTDSGGGGTGPRATLIGLNQDGSADAAFGAADGTADGIVTFDNPAGTTNLTPAALALAADGRLAVTGDAVQTSPSSNDSTFVSVRNADGTPVLTFGLDMTGTVVADRSGNATSDAGTDVAFRPAGGVIVLAQVGAAGSGAAVLHAYTDAGTDDPTFSDDGDLVLEVGEAPVVPAAMLVYAGRFWVTGSARTGVDTNAFLARVEADGTGLQSRQFDMRGQLIDPALSVTSQGSALTVVAGNPDTLVVTGSVSSASSTDWAAAAFNEFSGDLAAAGFGDIAISVPGSGGINGVAAGPDTGVSVTGPYQETVTTPSSSLTYTRFGDARLLIDAEKTCNLKLSVTDPLELLLHPGVPGSVSLSVTNTGTRACGGSVSVPPPYALGQGDATGPVATGLLAPGATFTAKDVALTYSGPLKAGDTLTLTLTAAADIDASDNVDVLSVRFRYCDLALEPAGASLFVPSEGTRTFALGLRNGGTITCSKVRVGVTGQGRPGRVQARYSVGPGREVAGDVRAGALPGTPVGTRLAIVFTASGSGDVNAANDATTLNPVVLGVGDTDASRPRGVAGALHGVSRSGRGPASRKLRRVTRVDVAVRRLGKGCRWLAAAGTRRFRSVAPGPKGECLRPVWLRAKGTTRWSLATAGLPSGRYVLLSRATIGAGFREASFTRKDGNRRSFRVAR